MTIHRTLSKALNGQSIEGEIQHVRDAFNAGLVTARNKLSAAIAHANSLLPAIEHTDYQEAEAEAQAILGIAQHKLSIAVAYREEAERYETGFRTEHGLTYVPATPNAFLNAMLLVIICGAETVINSLFFQSAHLTASPSSALITAGLISLCNVAVSVSAGFFFGRKLSYGIHTAEPSAPEYKQVRSRARIGLSIFTGFLGWFHLSVGLIRSQEELTLVTHSLPAYWELATTPEALFLVLTGVCMSLLSYNKGLTGFSDQYHGYSDFGNTTEDARDNILDIHDEHKDEIETIFGDAAKAATKQFEANRKSVEQYNKAVGAALAAHRKLASEVSESESGVRVNIATLRQTQESVSAVSRRKSKQTDDPALYSFQSYLDVDLPERMSLPERTQSQAALSEAKARALGQLAELLSAVNLK